MSPVDVPIIRLSVNLHPEVAGALHRLCAETDCSVTEGVGRAISLWNIVEGERRQGRVIASERRTRRGRVLDTSQIVLPWQHVEEDQ